jgi:predicted methyltransferase
MAIAFAVSAFAFGNITFAAGGTAPDVSAALAAAVADYIADSGYFTRLFASVVGSKDHVYAVEPTAFFKFEHFVKAVGELQGYVEG